MDYTKFNNFIDKLRPPAKGNDLFAESLTDDELYFLKIEYNRWTTFVKGDSIYEGTTREDEKVAETILSYFGFGSEPFSVKVESEEGRTQLISIIRRFRDVVVGELWMNYSKPMLPKNHIDRKVCQKTPQHTEHNLIDVICKSEEKLVLISDVPGNGKSVALIKLESDLRKLDTNIEPTRIIVGLDVVRSPAPLNHLLGKISVKNFISVFAGYIPLSKVSSCPVYILIDGIDEAYSYRDNFTTVNDIITLLEELIPLADVKKIIVTTRPHLKDRLEKKFSVKSYSLVPLTRDDQIKFLTSGDSRFTLEAAEKLIGNSPELIQRDLLLNPRMLQLYSQVCDENDIVKVYSSLFQKIHELYFNQKCDVHPPDLKYAMKDIIPERLPCYNYYALKEVLGNPHSRNLVMQKQKKGYDIFQKTNEREDIFFLSCGLVIPGEDKTVKFYHKSFAYYFLTGVLKALNDPQIPRELQNTLLGKIYGQNDPNKYKELEIFIFNEPNIVPEIITNFEWIFSGSTLTEMCQCFVRFMEMEFPPLFEKKFIPFLLNENDEVSEWKKIAVVGDSRSESGFQALLNDLKLHENKKHLRDALSGCSFERKTNAARLILTVEAANPDHVFFSEGEVNIALEICEADGQTDHGSMIKNTKPAALHEADELQQQNKTFTLQRRIQSPADENFLFDIPGNGNHEQNNISPKKQPLIYSKIEGNSKIILDNSMKLFGTYVPPAPTLRERLLKSQIPGKCFFLKFIPDLKHSETPEDKSSFPTLYEFAACSQAVYNKEGLNLPPGWSLLQVAKSQNFFNGYYGAAYVNERKKQIIVAHRGTQGFRPWITNLCSIFFNIESPRVISAVTFANHVKVKAEKDGYEIFFTGHSLGGWLAQFTCFTSIHFSQSPKDSRHFVCTRGPNYSSIRPFTISFDSPGNYNYIDRMRLKYFPLEQRVHVNLETLPCETYLFYPNVVNMHNFKIGSHYNLDLGHKWWRQVSLFGLFTHKMSKPVEVLKEKGETAVCHKLQDYKPTPKLYSLLLFATVVFNLFSLYSLVQLLPNSLQPPGYKPSLWTLTSLISIPVVSFYMSFVYLTDNLVQLEENSLVWRRILKALEYFFTRCKCLFPEKHLVGIKKLLRKEKREDCPWNENYFSNSFFNGEELHFLQQSFTQGQFEGTYFEYEDEANKLLGLKICKENNEITTQCRWKDRTTFIPLVRRTVKRLREGSLWVNKNKPALPLHYIKRHVEMNGEPQFLMDSIQQEDFVFIVGESGVGKSCEMTRLEVELRSYYSNLPRIIMRINLNEIKDQLSDLHEDKKINFSSFIESILSSSKVCSWFEHRNQILLDIKNGQLPLILLLDGLDEVCPDYTETMVTVLRSLVDNQLEGEKKFVSLKVVLTARPHLKERIQAEFGVSVTSICVLTEEQQKSFLTDSTSMSEDESEKALENLSDPDIMQNPMLLYLYSEVLKDPNLRVESFDLFTLYELFVRSMVKRQEEKKGAQYLLPHHVREWLEVYLPYYNYIALSELFQEKVVQAVMDLDEELGLKDKTYHTVFNKKLTESRRKTLLTHLMVTADKRGTLKFKHRSFADYFVAAAMIDKENTHVEMRNMLFGHCYENRKNIAKFAVAARKKKGGIFVTPDWVKYADAEGGIRRYYGHRDDGFIEEIFTEAINYKDKNAIGIGTGMKLADFLLSDGGWAFYRWLQKLDVGFARKNVFYVENGKVTDSLIPVLVEILFDPEKSNFATEVLQPEEIRESIKDAPSLVEKGGEWLNLVVVIQRNKSFREVLKNLECWVPDKFKQNEIFRKTVQLNSDKFMEESCSDPDLAWRLHKCFGEEMKSLICRDERVSDIVVKDLGKVMNAWGVDFVPGNLLKLRSKFTKPVGESILNFNNNSEIFDIIWGQVQNDFEDAIELILEERDIRLVKLLEENLVPAVRKTTAYSSEGDLHSSAPAESVWSQVFLKRLGILKAIVSGALDKGLEIERLTIEEIPYIIAYGSQSPKFVEAISRSAEKVTWRLRFDNLQDAFRWVILSALVDDRISFDENGTSVFEVVKRWLRNLVVIESDEKNLDKLHESLIYELTNLGIEPFKISGSTLEIKRHIELQTLKQVLELSRSELLAVMKKAKIDLQNTLVPDDFTLLKISYLLEHDSIRENSSKMKLWEEAFAVLIKRGFLATIHSEVASFLNSIKEVWDIDVFKRLLSNEKFHGFLSTNIIRLTQTVGTSCIDTVELFRIHKDAFQDDYKWVLQFIKETPVELATAARVMGDTQLMGKVKEAARGILTAELDSICGIHKIYYCEQDCLELLKMLGAECKDSSLVCKKKFATWIPPLLRAWIRAFGKQKAREEAGKHFVWSNLRTYHDHELLHVAIELGMTEAVKLFAWPGSVQVINEREQNALEFALETLGKNHDITRFLEELTGTEIH